MIAVKKFFNDRENVFRLYPYTSFLHISMFKCLRRIWRQKFKENAIPPRNG